MAPVDSPPLSESGQVQSAHAHLKPKSQEHAIATQAARSLSAALEGLTQPLVLMHFFSERFVATHMLRSSYLLEGKSSEYIFGFTVAGEYERDDDEWVRLLTDPNHVHRRGGKADELFVDVCFGMIGKLGSMADGDTDTQPSASKNGGFFFRRSSQVFPMLRFRQDRLEDFSTIRDKVERAVSDIFQSRPSTISSVLMALPNGRRSSYNPRKVQKWDVICDRTDPRTPNHFGNKRFSIVVCMYLIKDYDMKNVAVRVRVSRSIILTIHEGKHRAMIQPKLSAPDCALQEIQAAAS